MYANEIPLNMWLREEAEEKGREFTYSEKITYGVQAATANHCAKNCFRALYFINSQKKFANIFKKQAVLCSATPPDDQPHRIDRWPWHYYALLKDKAGVYYAISPANYDPAMKENSLNTVISSKDLKGY